MARKEVILPLGHTRSPWDARWVDLAQIGAVGRIGGLSWNILDEFLSDQAHPC